MLSTAEFIHPLLLDAMNKAYNVKAFVFFILLSLGKKALTSSGYTLPVLKDVRAKIF